MTSDRLRESFDKWFHAEMWRNQHFVGALQLAFEAGAALTEQPDATAPACMKCERTTETAFHEVQLCNDCFSHLLLAAPAMTQAQVHEPKIYAPEGTVNGQEGKYTIAFVGCTCGWNSDGKAYLKEGDWHAHTRELPPVAPPAHVSEEQTPSERDLYASYANHCAIQKKVPLTWHSWKREKGQACHDVRAKRIDNKELR